MSSDSKSKENIRPPRNIRPELRKGLGTPTVSKAQSEESQGTENKKERDSGPLALSDNNPTLPVIKSTLSPFAKEFVPREQTVPKERRPGPPLNNKTLQALQSFFNEVGFNPAKFNIHAETLSMLLCEYTVFTSVVDFLFDQAICNTNIMYFVAKLLDVLITKLRYGDQLRVDVVEKCSSMYDDAATFIERDLRGLGIFMGELYSQIKLDNDEHITTIKDEIVRLCRKIIEQPNSDNIKCVSKILKLVGIYAAIGDSLHELNGLVDQLVELAQAPQHTNDVRDLVNSVFKLKESNWGKSIVDPLPASFNNLAMHNDDETVYYGPDGKPFTEEELAFINSNLPAELDIDSDDEDLYNDEVDQAYEQFLRETENQ